MVLKKLLIIIVIGSLLNIIGINGFDCFDCFVTGCSYPDAKTNKVSCSSRCVEIIFQKPSHDNRENNKYH